MTYSSQIVVKTGMFFDDRIFNSRIDLPGLLQLRKMAENRACRGSGIVSDLYSYGARVLWGANTLLTRPVLFAGRQLGRGGIMISVARRLGGAGGGEGSAPQPTG